MKICVTAIKPSLEAPVDPHFGRCNYFLMVDPVTMDFKYINNRHVSASGGAGVQAAQETIGEGIDVLITGSVGPNAYSLLSSENVTIKSFCSGSVREAIEAYRSGSLENIDAANSPGKHGL
ncbi:MAG: NifB/NifX family molybdenum-iron cluster-binding protein [Methanolobus sp.]|nr:NifB/NifX family molybdenum-iron cluster-binding protein [Methanolobus sp.]